MKKVHYLQQTIYGKALASMVFSLIFMLFTTLGGFAQSPSITKSAEEKPLTKDELIKVLKESDSDSKRIYAAIDLQKYKTEDVVDALCDTMIDEAKKRTPSYTLIKFIVRSLGEIANKKAFVPLLKASQLNVTPEIRDEMDKAMEKLKWK